MAKTTATTRSLLVPGERDRALGELEALLFAANRPVAVSLIARRLYLEESDAVELLEQLRVRMIEPARGLQLRETAGKWRLETKPEHDEVIASVRAERGEKRLTGQALESLAVIALRQPVTTEEVTAIRGAESYGTIETLRRHKLIARAEQRGTESRAARWRTTQHFLDQFGLADLQELYQEGRLQHVFGDVYEDDDPGARKTGK